MRLASRLFMLLAPLMGGSHRGVDFVVALVLPLEGRELGVVQG